MPGDESGSTTETGQEPNGGTTPEGQEPKAGEGQEPEGGTSKLSHDDALAALAAANREAAATRTAKTAAEARVAELEREKLSEQDKLKADTDSAVKRADEAEGRALKAEVRLEVMRKAPKLGFTEPGLLDRLIDYEKVTVESDGTLKGVDEQLAALKKDYPSLLGGGGGGDGGEGSGGAPATGMNDKMREMLGR